MEQQGRKTAEGLNTHFTVVFEGDIRDITGNPYHIISPFGKPVRIFWGDALEKLDAAYYDGDDQ